MIALIASLKFQIHFIFKVNTQFLRWWRSVTKEDGHHLNLCWWMIVGLIIANILSLRCVWVSVFAVGFCVKRWFNYLSMYSRGGWVLLSSASMLRFQSPVSVKAKSDLWRWPVSPSRDTLFHLLLKLLAYVVSYSCSLLAGVVLNLTVVKVVSKI